MTERQCVRFWDTGLETQFDYLSRPPVVLIGLGQSRVPEKSGREPRETEGDRRRPLGRDVSYFHLKPKVRESKLAFLLPGAFGGAL